MQLKEWMQNGLCRRKNTDFWYPPLETDMPDKYYDIGRELCHRCPVWKDCLDSGLEERWGMWGGLTPTERLAITNASPKPSVLKPHGTWIRFRQGCRCSDCVSAHEKIPTPISIEIIPGWHEGTEDLEMLRFRLFAVNS